MTWIDDHCCLEDFFDLVKQVILLWDTLDPARPSIVAVATLLPVLDSVLLDLTWRAL